jgi:uncharacterized membrane protein
VVQPLQKVHPIILHGINAVVLLGDAAGRSAIRINPMLQVLQKLWMTHRHRTCTEVLSRLAEACSNHGNPLRQKHLESVAAEGLHSRWDSGS